MRDEKGFVLGPSRAGVLCADCLIQSKEQDESSRKNNDEIIVLFSLAFEFQILMRDCVRTVSFLAKSIGLFK